MPTWDLEIIVNTNCSFSFFLNKMLLPVSEFFKETSSLRLQSLCMFKLLYFLFGKYKVLFSGHENFHLLDDSVKLTALHEWRSDKELIFTMLIHV